MGVVLTLKKKKSMRGYQREMVGVLKGGGKRKKHFRGESHRNQQRETENTRESMKRERR